ncbi:uncharacterized protein [Dermacentor andersoni]|uniref:uncharacterized protein n=1 Tax=Dermacentor andersoni TaxID=34620 RepID=UPI002155F74E|nr:keratin, type II cytoskeletal 1-like [Dermacentor andersoni]
MRGVALSALCLLWALAHTEAGGGGYGGGAVAVATPVIAKTTPILVAASKPVLPSMGNAGHYLGYAGNVFEQLLRFSGHYGLPSGGGGGGKGLLRAVSVPVFSGSVMLGHGLGRGGGGGGGAFLLGHGGGYGGGSGFGGGSIKTYKLAHSSYGVPVGLPVSLAHGWH